MAETFKSRGLANIGTTAQEIYSAPAGKASAIVQLDIANVKSSPNAVVYATVYMKKGGIDYYLVKNTAVAIGGSLQVIRGQRMVLETGDAVWVKSSDASSLDAVFSVIEDVNV